MRPELIQALRLVLRVALALVMYWSIGLGSDRQVRRYGYNDAFGVSCTYAAPGVFFDNELT